MYSRVTFGATAAKKIRNQTCFSNMNRLFLVFCSLTFQGLFNFWCILKASHKETNTFFLCHYTPKPEVFLNFLLVLPRLEPPDQRHVCFSNYVRTHCRAPPDQAASDLTNKPAPAADGKLSGSPLASLISLVYIPQQLEWPWAAGQVLYEC